MDPTDTLMTFTMVLGMMLWSDWRLTLLTLIPLPLVSYVVYKLGQTIHKKFEAKQQQFSLLTMRAQENLSGIRIVNYLEGLHIPFVHPALNQTLDMSAYHYELGRASVLQLALARPDEKGSEAAFEPPTSSPEHGRRVAAYYWWLFPNLMFNIYPWGLSVNVVMPLSPSRTRVIFRSFVAEPALLGQGAGGALDPVEMEDEAAVLGVQRGIRSRLYSKGRYSPQHERGTHHFHRLIGECLLA